MPPRVWTPKNTLFWPQLPRLYNPETTDPSCVLLGNQDITELIFKIVYSIPNPLSIVGYGHIIVLTGLYWKPRLDFPASGSLFIHSQLTLSSFKEILQNSHHLGTPKSAPMPPFPRSAISDVKHKVGAHPGAGLRRTHMPHCGVCTVSCGDWKAI